MSMKFKFGADPELFVSQGDRFVSGHGMIPGDKKNPYPVKFGAVQVDGMALEFNIVPVEDEAGFIHNLTEVMTQLKAMVPGYELNALPCVEFSKEVMEAQPKEALVLGCDPDFNAWTQNTNEAPNASVNFRTGSGHIHIGWTDGENVEDPVHREGAFRIARQMDFFLGLPSLFFDNDTKRRELYGKAGACRVKPYGVEYRVLSNSWLRSKALMSWAFRSAKHGMLQAEQGVFLEDKFGDIQEIINTSNLKEANSILKHAKISMPI